MSANYCARCGAHLVKGDEPSDVTMTYTLEEAAAESGPLDDVRVDRPALGRRRGGGRRGERFPPAGPRTVIGRSPDWDVFLDDVPVSRRHAVLVNDNGRFSI